jgi:glutamate 5-kinase
MHLGTSVVLKFGSNLVVRDEGGDGGGDGAWLDSVAAGIKTLKSQQKNITVVTSGAVALGRKALKLGTKALSLEEKQAASAAGQIVLAQRWQAALANHGLVAAQVLLTAEDTEDRRRHLNARRTLETLHELGAIPIINENDTIATAEIRVGDNDRLAARVAQMLSTETLILFSDIDGLYTDNPRTNPNAQHLAVIEKITPAIEAMARGAITLTSTGGMITKIQAARIATAAGCTLIIANGTGLHPLDALIQGGRHTRFDPTTTPLSARKRWIAGMLNLAGTLTIDAGAAKALHEGKSLLPAGITAVEGIFERGDTVGIAGSDGMLIAKGLCAYDSDELTILKGRQTRDIAAVLGYNGRAEVVHRDDYVLLERP